MYFIGPLLSLGRFPALSILGRSRRAVLDIEGSARVALHGSRVADRGLVGVLTGGAARPALVEEIPALVEGHTEVLEPLLLFGGDLSAAFAFPELVLLVRDLVDPLDHLFVVHRALLL
jgi:hypothetical protein